MQTPLAIPVRGATEFDCWSVKSSGSLREVPVFIKDVFVSKVPVITLVTYVQT